MSRRPGTFTGDLVEGWKPLYLNEFRGVTENGTITDGLYPLTAVTHGEEAPVDEMVDAARDLLAELSDVDRSRISYPIDAVEWQTWANPEFMQFDTGVRLEFQSQRVRQLALRLVEASLSPEGFRIVRNMMLINGFLGEVVGLETILNEFSYNVALYGEPSVVSPWGWQLYGHHCAVNCLIIGGRMVVSPVFLGAEPNEIDDGPHAGIESFTGRIELGIELMAALTDDQRREATVYGLMNDPAMPPGRVHPGDERHLAGAFQDNRVIPFEGNSRRSDGHACQTTSARDRRTVRGIVARGTSDCSSARDRRAPGPDMVLLDRRAPPWRRLLLPHPIPGLDS